MRFRVLAIDYDGTIAINGHLDRDVRAAIGELRARGVVVIIVTGRILDRLRSVVGDLGFVDAIVAENGAVVALPESGRSRVLARAPDATLFPALQQRGIPYDRGECVVELDAAHAQAALAVIRDLELPLVLAFNRARLMLLPQTVSKATGLREALSMLRLSVHNALAIGDAENDHELLQVCEVGVAVAWGSPALKAVADEVLPGDGPPAVATYIRQAADQVLLRPSGRRRLLLGQDERGQAVQLKVEGRNVLVAGDPRSGKSWAAGLLCEQLILHGYCVCIIDPEGDYRPLEAMPGVVTLGGDDVAPRPLEVERAIRYTDISVLIDLSRVPHRRKVDAIRDLLPRISALRRRTGLPHRLVVDEAHYFLNDANVTELVDLELGGTTFITYRVSSLPATVLRATEATIVTRETDPDEVRQLAALYGKGGEAERWLAILQELPIGEAALLPRADEAGGALRRIRLVQRLTPHVRHKQKYMDVPVGEEHAFVFSAHGQANGPRVRTLKEFVDVLASAPVSVLEDHLRRSDFSRWIGDVFGDRVLAQEIARVEHRYGLDRPADVAGALIQAVRERYTDVD